MRLHDAAMRGLYYAGIVQRARRLGQLERPSAAWWIALGAAAAILTVALLIPGEEKR